MTEGTPPTPASEVPTRPRRRRRRGRGRGEPGAGGEAGDRGDAPGEASDRSEARAREANDRGEARAPRDASDRSARNESDRGSSRDASDRGETRAPRDANDRNARNESDRGSSRDASGGGETRAPRDASDRNNARGSRDASDRSARGDRGPRSDRDSGGDRGARGDRDSRRTRDDRSAGDSNRSSRDRTSRDGRAPGERGARGPNDRDSATRDPNARTSRDVRTRGDRDSRTGERDSAARDPNARTSRDVRTRGDRDSRTGDRDSATREPNARDSRDTRTRGDRDSTRTRGDRDSTRTRGDRDSTRSRGDRDSRTRGDRDSRSRSDRDSRSKRTRERARRAALAPLEKPRRLDLDRPATDSLAPEEVHEMNEHLAFLRAFKSTLRLSLNAAEDLLINGAKPPSDRGLCKHLLSKIDRKLVERTLAREAFEKDPPLRARFLAGVVRLNPEVSVLLWYLETLANLADKHEAAAAFALTVDRINFAELSNAQLASLLEVLLRTFQSHDRIQALFGLLSSDSFAATLERALPALSPEQHKLFAPLRAAYRTVVLARPLPPDENERAEVDRGIALLLDAPERVIRSYPLPIRARLAELVVRERDLGGGVVIPRSLLDSLPHHDELYANLALARAEQLLAAQDESQARAILSQLVQAHPELTRAVQRHEALAWRKVGRITIAPEQTRHARLLRAFWIDGSTFIWARTAPAEHAGQLALEAQIQESTLLPGVVPALAHGIGEGGTAFVAIAPGGKPIDASWLANLTLPESLTFVLEAVKVLRALAIAGLELPDADLTRFLLERGGVHGLRLADFQGIARRDPSAAAIAHGPHAVTFAKRVFTAAPPAPEAGADAATPPAAPAANDAALLRDDLPAAVRAKLRVSVPLPIFGRTLVEQLARISDL